jgi:DNA-binding MarR family transcriptional regulator
MQDLEQQQLVSDLDRRLNALLRVELSERASRLFKFIWRCELEGRFTDITAAIAYLDTTSRRPAYNAIHELENQNLVQRVVDEKLRRRKLLRVTMLGWDVLASMSKEYSDLIVDHVKRLKVQSTAWVEFHETQLLKPDNYLASVSAFCDWAKARGSEPIPARFLSRIFIIDCEDPKPESFVVSYWGRGMLLQGGRDFSGQLFEELKKCSSAEYWRNGVKEILNTLEQGSATSVSETRMSFGGKVRDLEKVVIPDRPNNRAIVGTWFVDRSKDKPARKRQAT